MGEPIYPKDFFDETSAATEPTCFVLMPFRPEFETVYQAIREACKRANLDCQRADEIFRPGPVLTQIMHGIHKAKVVVADLTGGNPNVFYELGMAHVVKRNVVLLAQDPEQVPFDLRHLRFVSYSATELDRLIGDLVRTIDELQEEAGGRGRAVPTSHVEMLASRNLGDATSPRFGHNDQSTRLSMRRRECSTSPSEPASSFAIFSAVPQSPAGLSLDSNELRAWLNPNARKYQPDPGNLFIPIDDQSPRLDGVICTEKTRRGDSDLWAKYLLLKYDGYAEYGAGYARCYKDEVYFALTPMVAGFWSFIHFVQDFYLFGKSTAAFQAYLTMVNTRNSQLGHLGQGWREPWADEFGERFERRCEHDHVQLASRLLQPKDGPDLVREAVKDLARRIDHAYGVWDLRAFNNPIHGDPEQLNERYLRVLP